jgi:WD40 repeat protein
LASEVYVRDRTNGKIEMVSVSSDGSQSNRDNGLTFMERGYYSVNISADGRYVVFESAANNLSSATNPDCNNFDNITCVFLYVHDRQTGITKTISALPDQDFTLLPGVSSDGRWISYMEYFHSCSETQMRCSNVMLYDQQSGWTSNLTNYGSAAPRLPWTYTGGIALPWQTWESGAIAVSGDNKLIALGGSDASVRIWNTARIDIQNVLGTANYMFNIGGTMSFSSVAFSGDGKWLAGGTTGGDIYIWNIENRQLSYQLAGHYDLIRSLVFTPDGSDLIIATSKEVWVWNFRTDQFSNIDPENLDISGVYCVAIAPRGDLAAVAYLDGTIWLQSLPSGKFIDRLGPDLFSVSSLVFSQDGSMLAASQRDGTIHIWQINWTNETVASIIPYNKFQSYVSVGQLVFSPDHEYLASTGTVGEVPIWNISSGILFNVTMAIPNEMVFGLQFTADGKKLAVEFESRIDVWDIPSQQPLQYFSYAYKDNFIDSSPFSAGTVNDLPRWHDRMRNLQGVYLDLSQAASAVDYPLIVPGILPQDFTFLSAMVNYDGSVWLRYVANISEGHQEYIYIYEQNIGSSDPPPVMVVGQGAEVALTQIATQSGYVPAESVQGDWLVRRSFTSPSDGSNTGISHYVWYWNSASISQHLRWQQDGILIGLYYQPYTPYGSYNSNFQSFSYLSNYSSTLSESDLEQIASGMVSFHDVSSPALSTAILRDDSGY